MTLLTSEQISAMRTTQALTMDDLVDIENIVILTDDYGDVTYSGITQSGIPCGFNFTKGVEIDKGQVIIVNYDANMRVQLGVTIGINDTVTLRQLAGETHSEVFEVFEYPVFDTTVKHIHLKRRSS